MGDPGSTQGWELGVGSAWSRGWAWAERTGSPQVARPLAEHLALGTLESLARP